MSNAEDFVRRFSIFWANPSPETMGELLTPDVRLVQPLSAEMRGIQAVQAEFRKLFSWLPDLRASVDRWSSSADCVFIEFRLRATIGGRVLEWAAVDRFTLSGEKATERVSYFDGLPLVLHALGRPTAVWDWWRSGAARPWARH